MIAEQATFRLYDDVCFVRDQHAQMEQAHWHETIVISLTFRSTHTHYPDCEPTSLFFYSAMLKA